MKIPDGMNEAEVLDVIEQVAKRLSYKFVFGYHSVEDIKQMATIFAIEGLNKYEADKPLINFLYIHVRNKLINEKRNKYERREKPCINCPLKAYIKETDECTAYEELTCCEFYKNWVNRNNNKKNIMSPIGITEVDDEQENSMKLQNDAFDNFIKENTLALINKYLPIHLRKDLHQVLYENKNINTKRMKPLKDAILEIIEKYE